MELPKYQNLLESILGGSYDLFPRTSSINPPVTQSPSRLNPEYFDNEGNPTQKLTETYERVRQEVQQVSPSIEIFGIYIVGSNAIGDFHENSDLDIYIHGRVGYSEGKQIANELSDRINRLSDHYSVLEQYGIDPNQVDEDLLKSKGLLEDGEEPSLIKIMDKLGIIKKSEMIDTIVGGGTPWGVCYDLQNNKWTKFKDGDKKHQGPISEFIQYGF